MTYTRGTASRVAVLLLVSILGIGCIGREADPRQVEDAVEDAMERDTTVRALEARVDSLERAIDVILARAGDETAPEGDVIAQRPARRPEQNPAQPGAEPETRPLPEASERRAAPAPAQTWPDDVRYETYTNERHGYSIDYPANVMQPVEALDGGNGYQFASSDDRAILAVYGVNGVRPEALGELYQTELRDPKQRVTYKTLHDGWFVISGYRGGKIFYERTLLRGGVLKTFLLIYDASLKEYFNPVTEHISFSFEG